MAKDDSKVEVLLQDLIIVQLALAGVPGAEIRKVAGVQMNRVTKILKVVKKRGISSGH
jgi:hypothetical protein